ncbi:MAG: DEAD/DEAH box helicase [Candidatus Eremiobacteraeota bacterium]|nr:DEAD/DEAH box helicase [Candidatus Eremiobacteraeota bacterium]
MTATAAVNPFFRLSQRLRDNIVSRLGWRSLRPVQELSIDPLIEGNNALVLAPTAGGKTEAAMLPLLDSLVARPPASTAIIYLSPLRALINNQEDRVEFLAGLVGATSFKWHGEVPQNERNRYLDQPDPVLLITPESLEVIVSSRGYDKKKLFGDLRAVVIDEIHAFAGDDRGDHLVALLERLSRMLGNDFQRVGLSATVGNPAKLLEWLCGQSQRGAKIVDPGRAKARRLIEVRPLAPEDDRGFIGSLLAQGKKSLLFTDSRGQAEKLQKAMAGAGVRTLAHHSSLSKELREETENAFRAGSNCCIVCTSTLELGLDVGDLDLVMQCDAPYSVSAFLQRLGRTGRREGSRGHMCFLTDQEWSFLRACALVSLAVEGYVEPVRPTTRASHVFVQQLLLRVLEGGDTGIASLLAGMGNPYCFRDLTAREREEIVAHLLAMGALAKVDSRLIFGPEGEKRFATSNFRDLYCVFDSSNQLTVVTRANRTVGSIEAWFAQSLGKTGFVFSLGGRAWKALECDWNRGVLVVEQSLGGSAPSWTGPPRPLSRRLAEKIRDLLVEVEPVAFLAEPAQAVLDKLRSEWGRRLEDGPTVEAVGKRLRILTFAGGQVNNLLARYLELHMGSRVASNNYWLMVDLEASRLAEILVCIGGPDDLAAATVEVPRGRLSKFQELLPPQLEREFLLERLYDIPATLEVVERLKEARWQL